MTPAQAAAVLAIFRRQGGAYLGRGNFGQAVLVTTPPGPAGPGGPVLIKVPVTHDIHRRPWDTAELRDAFQHEARVANALTAAGLDVAPHTTFVEDAAGFALVREYGAPVGAISFAEWDRLGQRLSAAQDAGWWVRDELLLLRRPGSREAPGALFVGDVGVWVPKRPGLDDWQDDQLTWRLAAAAREHNGRPFQTPSWYATVEAARRLRGRILRPEAARYSLGVFHTLLGSATRELGALVRARQAHGAPVPGEAFQALAAATRAYRARGAAPPVEPPVTPSGGLAAGFALGRGRRAFSRW